LEKFYNEYKDRAEFFLIYVREAHPSDKEKGKGPNKSGPQVETPKAPEDRAVAASDCVRDLKLSMPVLIDDMAGTAEKAYRGWPARLVVVDADGKVAYCTQASPQGANPKEAVAVVGRLVGEK